MRTIARALLGLFAPTARTNPTPTLSEEEARAVRKHLLAALGGIRGLR